MRLENPPSSVSSDDWVDLVRYFGSEEFTKISNRNKENRKKQTIGHIARTKAFARISYDSRDLETGNEPSRTKLWFTTGFSEKKGIRVDSSSQEVYDKLKKLESQPLEEGIPPMTEDERFEVVLGPKGSAYIRGRGADPKPTTCTAGQRIRVQLERENEEFRRRAENDKRIFEDMEKEKKKMALRLESQVALQQAQMHGVQVSVKSQFITLFQQFKDRGQIPMRFITGQKPKIIIFYILFEVLFYYDDVDLTFAS